MPSSNIMCSASNVLARLHYARPISLQARLWCQVSPHRTLPSSPLPATVMMTLGMRSHTTLTQISGVILRILLWTVNSIRKLLQWVVHPITPKNLKFTDSFGRRSHSTFGCLSKQHFSTSSFAWKAREKQCIGQAVDVAVQIRSTTAKIASPWRFLSRLHCTITPHSSFPSCGGVFTLGSADI